MNSGFSVHWHWNTHGVGYYDRRGLWTHLVNTSWVFSMNTKLRFTVFIIHVEFKIKYIHLYAEISLLFKILSKLFSVNAAYIEKLVESSHGYWCILQCLLWNGCYGCTIVMSYNGYTKQSHCCWHSCLHPVCHSMGLWWAFLMFCTHNYGYLIYYYH